MSRDAKEGCGTHYALQAIGFLFLLFASLNTTMLIIGAQLPALDGESKGLDYNSHRFLLPQWSSDVHVRISSSHH